MGLDPKPRLNKTGVKTLSWLIVSGLLICGAAYYETHDLSKSLLTAFWACALKTPVYSLHEALFERWWHR
jgi:uncharacterized membrane protein